MSEEKNNIQPSEKRIVVEPQAFPGTLSNLVTTAEALGGIINEVFAGVFSDYAGCRIIIDEVKKINWPHINKVFLYFEDQGEPKPGMIKNLYMLGKTNNNGERTLARGLAVLSERGKGKTYELNDETKEYLSEFRSSFRGKPAKWKDIVLEKTEPSKMGTFAVATEVELDLIAILKKIWGTKVDGDPVQYGVNILSPLYSNAPINQQFNYFGMPITNGYTKPIDYLINITQVNVKEVNKAVAVAGFSNTVASAIPMVRKK